jgi:hypothetical protein
VLGACDDARTNALAARARRLLGPEDAVVIVPPGETPAWLSAELLEGRSQRGGVPTAYLCRGQVCGLPATDPEALRLP